jgi:twinkle protein
MEASTIKLADIVSCEVIDCEEVYDLTIEDNHNFYLATNSYPILVHNSGKSTWLDYMFIRLAVKNNWRFGLFSPENIPQLKLVRMVEQLTGKPLNSLNHGMMQAALDFLGQRFIFYNTEKIEDYSLTNLLRIGSKMVTRAGVDCICLDPFNYIEMDGDEQDHTQKIGGLLRKLKLFAVKHNVLVVLVAHPRKMDKTGNHYNVPRLYDISGSHHFFNVPDWGLVVHRTYNDGVHDPVQVHIQKHKYHFRGKLGSVDYYFDRGTGRYSEDGNYDTLFNARPTDENNAQNLFSPLQAWRAD